jgi:hypothetical protein
MDEAGCHSSNQQLSPAAFWDGIDCSPKTTELHHDQSHVRKMLMAGIPHKPDRHGRARPVQQQNHVLGNSAVSFFLALRIVLDASFFMQSEAWKKWNDGEMGWKRWAPHLDLNGHGSEKGKSIIHIEDNVLTHTIGDSEATLQEHHSEITQKIRAMEYFFPANEVHAWAKKQDKTSDGFNFPDVRNMLQLTNQTGDADCFLRCGLEGVPVNLRCMHPSSATRLLFGQLISGHYSSKHLSECLQGHLDWETEDHMYRIQSLTSAQMNALDGMIENYAEYLQEVNQKNVRTLLDIILGVYTFNYQGRVTHFIVTQNYQIHLDNIISNLQSLEKRRKDFIYEETGHDGEQAELEPEHLEGLKGALERDKNFLVRNGLTSYRLKATCFQDPSCILKEILADFGDKIDMAEFKDELVRIQSCLENRQRSAELNSKVVEDAARLADKIDAATSQQLRSSQVADEIRGAAIGNAALAASALPPRSFVKKDRSCAFALSISDFFTVHAQEQDLKSEIKTPEEHAEQHLAIDHVLTWMGRVTGDASEIPETEISEIQDNAP